MLDNHIDEPCVSCGTSPRLLVSVSKPGQTFKTRTDFLKVHEVTKPQVFPPSMHGRLCRLALVSYLCVNLTS